MSLSNYIDLAPTIPRQRLVVEGYPAKAITEDAIKDYLCQLSDLTQMTTLMQPVTHRSNLYGWAGWIHWETSGAHFYAWEQPALFFSVDIYTCKTFDPQKVIDFTLVYFDTSKITAKDFSSSSPLTATTQPVVEPPEDFRYTLRQDEILKLSKRLLAEKRPAVTDQYICYRLDGIEELSNLGRHIEREVFEEKFGNDDAAMKNIYGAHERASIFFIVIDQINEKPIGTLRAIRNSAVGLVTLRDVEKMLGVSVESFKSYHDIDDLNSVWDIGTVAVPKKYRQLDGHLVSNMLYRAAYLRALHEKVHHFISICDADIHRAFNFIGFILQPLAGTGVFSYEGSEASMALYGKVADFVPAVERRLKNAEEASKPFLNLFVERFVAGQGIDQRLINVR